MLFTRFMTPDPFGRIVAHQFAPVTRAGEPLSDDTLGTARFVTRDQPGDVWGSPRDIAPGDVTLGDWRMVCESHGFTWEEES